MREEIAPRCEYCGDYLFPSVNHPHWMSSWRYCLPCYDYLIDQRLKKRAAARPEVDHEGAQASS